MKILMNIQCSTLWEQKQACGREELWGFGTTENTVGFHRLNGFEV
jgi:hypothetical protein